jgi:tripartite-type tricarboxylate transporter receptor subunit TctC
VGQRRELFVESERRKAMKGRILRGMLMLLGFSLICSQLAVAQSYPDPNKFLTIIAIVAAGGNSDMQIRAIAPHLSRHLGGTKIMVENIPGASGKIAYEKAYKAQPDGYLLLNYNLPAPIVTEVAEPGVRYKTADFVPVYAISSVPNVLVVNSETWKTVDEFIEEARKRTVTLGTTGNKTANYLQAVAFADAVKIKANFIPFGGGAESVQTLAGKHIDAVCTTVLTAFPLVRAGKLRPLVVFSDEPDVTYPGVLLSKDSKWNIATFPLLGTYVAPPKLSEDKVRILEDAFTKSLKEPAFLDWAKKMNFDITPMNAAKVKSLTTSFYRDIDKYQSFFPK